MLMKSVKKWEKFGNIIYILIVCGVKKKKFIYSLVK